MPKALTEEDIAEIMTAASNQGNAHILQLTSKKIETLKRNILTELHVSPLSLFLKKLKQYRYVDNMNELKPGGFIRWIDIHDPTAELTLSGTAIFCDIRITDRGVSVVYTNFFRKKKYEFLMEEAIIFQKLTHQEEVLLYVMNKLH
jgi:hypothetical protein